MRTDRSRTWAKWLGLAVPLLLLFACTSNPTVVPSYNRNSRIVIPTVATGPTIDGLGTDAAWNSGFTYYMEHGGSVSATTWKGVATASNIYLYVEVEDVNFDDTDVLVIGLNPRNDTTDFRRIHIFPCKPTGICPANASSLTPTVEYFTGIWKNSAYTWTSVANGSGIVAKSATATGGIKKWSVELSIPRGAPFNFNDTTFFGLFVDVASTDPTAGINGTATQYTWPAEEYIGSTNENDILADLETGTLGPSNWGNATLSTKFGNGISIYGNDIRSNDTSDPTKILLTAPAQFFADVGNYSSSSGTLVAAHAVTATFTIYNSGLPGGNSWTNVPVSGNPTAAADIPPAQAYTFATGLWTLTPTQQTQYGANPHQCLRVHLATTDANTIIVNNDAQQNMDFVTTNSPFRAHATVATNGTKVRPEQATLPFILREDFINFDPSLRWKTQIVGATPVGERAYSIAPKYGSEQPLDITVDPPELKIPFDSVLIGPGTGGPRRPPVSLEVRPDELITFISSGTLDFGGRPVTAAGAVFPQERTTAARAPANRRYGALLGSFDGFKSSFVIGNASTIKVPRTARSLQLKIDDDSAHYAQQKGAGYSVQVTRTPIESYMLQANPSLAEPVTAERPFVTLGANMPTWILRGTHDTGRWIKIGGKKYRVYGSSGSFGYIINRPLLKPTVVP